jgi:hypothetical protein
MKTVPLADVLWTAANVYLKAAPDEHGTEAWSCNAALIAQYPSKVQAILTRVGLRKLRDESDVATFLEKLGCPIRSDYAFPDYCWFEETQGVRYMWLLLAMHVAEDEKIMVEVA